jgi:hypothetical protein
MEIGDLVIYAERAHILRGVEPMSSPGRCAQLEDPQTGQRLFVPLDQVSQITHETAPAEV